MYITIINILMFIISISIAIIIIIIIIIIITIAVATISIVSHVFWRHTFAHVFLFTFYLLKSCNILLKSDLFRKSCFDWNEAVSKYIQINIFNRKRL